MNNPNCSAVCSAIYANRPQMNMNRYLYNVCNLFNIKITISERIGRIQSVNKILIVNISGSGRLGKEYKPAPVSKRSKYVPISEAKRIVDNQVLVLWFLW